MPDLGALFAFTVSPAELVLRGTAMYWFLFLLLRFVLRRDTGSIGVADILLLVLLADAAQNAMAGGYESVSDGCVLVATIAGWNWLLDLLAYRFPAVRRLIEAQPLPLVRNGRLVRRNLRQEMITVDELMAKLRENGIDRLDDVKAATMESDGEISVVKHEGEPPSRHRNSGDKPAG
ncbi:MAG TPA: YetF domain-containing protein [Ramlibacter sp.]|nr:YetF domain-containing protein [Ramlibacter sp.]